MGPVEFDHLEPRGQGTLSSEAPFLFEIVEVGDGECVWSCRGFIPWYSGRSDDGRVFSCVI